MKIFGVGTVVVDHVVVLDEFPTRDTKTPIQSHFRQIGGPVPIAFSTAAFYGARTYFMGRWGNDSAGREIAAGLIERGVNLSASLSDDEWTTGFAHVWTEQQTGSRTIAFHRGSFPQPTQDDLEASATIFDSCEILHLDGAHDEVALVAAHRMKRRGGLIVLDAGSKKPGMEQLLPLVDVLIASDLFCKSWFETTDVPVSEIHRLGPKKVVRTLAERGAMLSCSGEAIQSPALDIQPVDTNGAGDIFSGAFLYGITQRWDDAKCLAFANFVAGNACKHSGNSTYPPMANFVSLTP